MTNDKNWLPGVPVVVKGKPIWLGTIRFQVQSLTLLSGLRIQHCHELCCRLQLQLGSGVAVAVAVAGSCTSDLISSPGTSICLRCGSKKEKKKKNHHQQQTGFLISSCLWISSLDPNFWEPDLVQLRKLIRPLEQTLLSTYSRVGTHQNLLKCSPWGERELLRSPEVWFLMGT